MLKIAVKDADEAVARLARVARATGKPEAIRLVMRAERAAARFWNARDRMLQGKCREGYVRRLFDAKHAALLQLESWCYNQPKSWSIDFWLLGTPRKKRTGVTLGINQADAIRNFLANYNPFQTIVAIRVGRMVPRNPVRERAAA